MGEGEGIGAQCIFRPGWINIVKERKETLKKIGVMSSLPPMNLVSPSEDTVEKWVNNIEDRDSKIENKESGAIETDKIDPRLPPLDSIPLDSINIDPSLFLDAQMVMTEDLINPGTIQQPLLPPMNEENAKKRKRCDSVKKQRCAESENAPAWLRAENDLRLSFWNKSKARKVLKSQYIIPDTNEELSCFNMTDLKSPYFLRVVCNFLNPQKVTFGLRGPKMKKCEFESVYLDQIVAALTAIGKGAKTKTVNVGNRGGKLKMEVNNGSLSISQTFPADIKRFAQKNNIGGYFIPEDCHFSLPSSELNHLLETFLDTISFVKLKRNITEQRQRVFELAVTELVAFQSMMTTSQYAIKLFEIYYKMALPTSERYPISVVFPNYYKLFDTVFL